MASRTAVLAIRIVSDTKDAIKGMAETEKEVGRLEGALNKATPAAAATVTALGVMGKASIDAASDVQQSTGAVEAIFKSQAGAIKAYADNSADALGLSKNSYQEYAALVGAQMKNMGVSSDELVGKTNDLIVLGADLAAQFGGSTSDAVGALSALLRGERDPIEQYGVSLKQADIDAQKAAMGLTGLTGEAAKNADLMATLALLQEQTADATGTAAREADTAAGAQMRANARYEDAKAALGEKLLPAYAKFQETLASAASYLQRNSDQVLVVAGVLGGLATAVLAVNGALKTYRATMVAVKAVQAAWAAVAGAQWVAIMGPIALIVAVIAAVIAAVVLLWQKNEGFRNFVIGAWEAIKNAASTAWEWVQSAISTAVETGTRVVEGFRSGVASVWESIKNAAAAAWDFIYTWIVKPRIDAVMLVVNALKTGAAVAWNAIKTAAATAFAWIEDKATPPLNAVKSIIDKIKRAFDAVKDAVGNVIDKIRGIKFPSPPSWLPGFGSPLDDMTGYQAIAARAAAAGDPFFMTMAGGGLAGALSSLSSGSVSPASSSGSWGSGDTTVINLSVQTLDARKDGPILVEILDKTLRQQGKRTLGRVAFA